NSVRALRVVYEVNTNSTWGGEGALRNYSFKTDKCYQITFWRKFRTAEVSGIFHARLVNGLAEDLNFSTCYDPVPAVSGSFQNLLTAGLPALTQSGWEQMTFNFTPTAEFMQLWLYTEPASCNLSVVNSSFENIVQTTNYAAVPVGFGIRCAGTNATQLVQEGFGEGLSAPFSFRNCTQAIASVQSGAIISQNHMQDVDLAYSLEDDPTLAIQDIMGRVVYTLELSAGKENMSFSPGQVLPGMYILKVVANGEVLHLEKIIIIR
ncbi:MAG: T9SS type A sorting domain-containing protein, partial [Saprospiraceae bacterium]|nr:T9SS type A sorting domain-containing protein [Saprospiraceae bacterium]